MPENCEKSPIRLVFSVNIFADVRRRKERGASIIGLAVAAGLMGILMAGFLSMFKFQGETARSIAGRGGVTDLSHALDTLFGSPGCASIGSGNFRHNNSSPVTIALVAGSPPSYSVSIDTLRFSNGAMAITSQPDTTIANMLRPYTISSITFSALGGNGPTQYPFRMTVNFANSSGGPPPLPLTKFLTLITNPGRNVIGACFRDASGVSGTFGEFTSNGWSMSRTITVPSANSLLTFVGHGHANCSHPSGQMAQGINLVLSVDGVSCLNALNSMYAWTFTAVATATCMKSLSAGSHTLTVSMSEYPSTGTCSSPVLRMQYFVKP